MMFRLQRLCALSSLCLAAALSSNPAGAFELVSRSEMSASTKAAVGFEPKLAPVPNAPVIRVISPALGSALQSPINIQLAWEGVGGAKVDPASLKVSYGRLRLDITQRLLKHASVSPTGLEALDAKLPAGTHRLFVSVTDSLSRESVREFILEVADK